MQEKLYENDKVNALLTDYIYCSICDSLIFIPKNGIRADLYRDNYLKNYINEDTISKEYTRRKEIL